MQRSGRASHGPPPLHIHNLDSGHFRVSAQDEIIENDIAERGSRPCLHRWVKEEITSIKIENGKESEGTHGYEVRSGKEGRPV